MAGSGPGPSAGAANSGNAGAAGAPVSGGAGGGGGTAGAGVGGSSASGACRPKFASGLDVAWFNFAGDVPNPDIAQFNDLFQNTVNAGGRVVRGWFHTNGTNTPGCDSSRLANKISDATAHKALRRDRIRPNR